MTETRLPVEVELVYEVMPCNAMRTAQEPGQVPHPCTYFRRWGTYHCYDYVIDGAPTSRGSSTHPLPGSRAAGAGGAERLPQGADHGGRDQPQPARLVGRDPACLEPALRRLPPVRPLLPLPRDDEARARAADYAAYGGGPEDTPFSTFELDVPEDGHGERPISPVQQPQKMYVAYQGLLDSLAEAMGWSEAGLVVGEDLAYGNMVGCPSAKWTTVPSKTDPSLPPMTPAERDGIVHECFRSRQYFLRQLFQSLPAVILVLGQSTANAFIHELAPRFSVGAPTPGEPVEELLAREIRLQFGSDKGTVLDARVIFAPHITGNPAEFAPARDAVVAQLVAEAHAGRLRVNPVTRHLSRGAGACVFCPMLEIAPCDYVDELRPLAQPPALAPTPAAAVAAPISVAGVERAFQAGLREGLPVRTPIDLAWVDTDEPEGVRDGEG